jgi:nucleotide-binding universal stress UspA family protein
VASIGPLIVGIEDNEPQRVLVEAARLASDFDTDLVCAHFDSSRYPVDEHEDGSVTSMPLDPEIPDIRDEVVSQELEAFVRAALEDWSVSLRFVALAGDTAQALGELAERLDARAIVVGTRRPGFRAGLEKFFTGSVAVRLAHRQKRPVIVVPVEPHAAAAPWEFEA